MMVSFNFSPEHVPKVESGEKNQTIRRKQRGKVGDLCQLYTGMRTKACRKIRADDPPLIAVTYCAIRPDYLTLGDTSVAPRDLDTFARADGFKDYNHMLAWFEAKYGTPYFIGYLHIWAKKPVAPNLESP
jgi:hypothetical protein